MIVPDINLLIYAYDADSRFHDKARHWWQECLSGTEVIGLLQVVVFGFVRLVTNPRVFTQPYQLEEATQFVREWLQQPAVQLMEAPGSHVEQVLALLEQLGTAGNLVTDAQIAALAIEHGAVLHTNDVDFKRFAALRCFNPISTGRAA